MMLRNTTPNSSVVLNFANKIGESWDVKGKATNVKAICIQGDTITGLEWDKVQLQTVGQSFLSEATIKFSNSTSAGGVELSVGFGAEKSGTDTFSSGVFDLTDNAVADIQSTIDKQFLIELFELVDDNQNQIDARYLSGTVTVHGNNLTPVDGCPFIAAAEAQTDVTVKLLSEDSPSEIGDEFNIDLVVSNNTSVVAKNVIANLSISNNVELKTQNCAHGAKGIEEGTSLKFELADLASGDEVCNLGFEVTGGNEISFSAEVTANNDSNASNNNGSLGLGGLPTSTQSIPLNNKFFLGLLVLLIFGFSVRRIKA